MKSIQSKTIFLFLNLLFAGYSFVAQEEKAPGYITVTTLHVNTSNPDLKREDWVKVEKEYFEKVVTKNPYILKSNILTHYFTADNTEVISVYLYENWEAIDKAWQKSQELMKEAWPDEKARKAFYEKRSAFYTGEHSDEIYVVLPDRKLLNKVLDKQMIYYVRKSKVVNPKDGNEKEFEALNKEYMDNIMYKNDVVKAYYTYQHAWGSKANEFVEVFVYDNFADIEKAWDKEEELAKAHWKDEAKMKEFGKKYSKYFSTTHSDYIYRNEVGLQK